MNDEKRLATLEAQYNALTPKAPLRVKVSLKNQIRELQAKLTGNDDELYSVVLPFQL